MNFRRVRLHHAMLILPQVGHYLRECDFVFGQHDRNAAVPTNESVIHHNSRK